MIQSIVDIVGFCGHIGVVVYIIHIAKKWGLIYGWFVFWISVLLLVQTVWRTGRWIDISDDVRMLWMPLVYTVVMWGSVISFNHALVSWVRRGGNKSYLLKIHGDIFGVKHKIISSDLKKVIEEMKENGTTK